MLLTGEIALVIIISLIIWSAGLSLFLWKLSSLYKNLIKEASGKSLVKILEKLIDSQDKQSEEFKSLKEKVLSLEEDTSFHIQKIGIVRFNPFSNTGGDQSFTLAVLDGHDSGFIITGLHSRDRTRFYIKPVRKAKSTYELSKEEREAIAKATKG